MTTYYPDKLNDFENRLFLLNDYKALAKLTMLRTTEFGKIDLAILSKNDLGVYESYSKDTSLNLKENQRIVGVGLALLRLNHQNEAISLNEKYPSSEFSSIYKKYTDLKDKITKNEDIVQNWKYYSETEKDKRLTDNKDYKQEISLLLKE
ncbi:hypothetical protein P7D73_18165 [Enterococcus raffinosus]|uniref:hypothetical protein n=1 Tax=Enterococcus raffinosus TaxID=71452 RepID=UPI002890E972|nr:hypothetical protein [Enterococcus raffinosus]MDT2525132.1 hypothetical protein [Enterococcus raffinosus]MDT2592487.1 hypothetical protein [Enterococcus raffinosus]